MGYQETAIIIKRATAVEDIRAPGMERGVWSQVVRMRGCRGVEVSRRSGVTAEFGRRPLFASPQDQLPRRQPAHCLQSSSHRISTLNMGPNGVPSLRLQVERALQQPVHPYLLSYCPTMDLIAVVNQAEQLDVYRLNGQRAFGLKQKAPDCKVDAICWKFNGWLSSDC